MSIRTTQKTVFAVAIALAAAAFGGCGSDNEPKASPQTAATGATHAVAPSETTGATATPEPTAPAANPNDPGSGDEEAARTGVVIGLKNGQFTKATPRKVHVPAVIAIELDITVADDDTYNLVITDSDGRERVVTYKKPGDYKVTIPGMSAKQRSTVVLGGEQRITITADAEPGP